MNRNFLLTFCLACSLQLLLAQSTYVSNVWVADQGNGTFKNPILHADYSDPDVCRVGDDFYMISSSFNAVPGLPVLHSKDLVNWKLIEHALQRQVPLGHFSKVQHGNGVWAPSIRHHNDEFWIYYPDPDFGIYLTKAKRAEGPWSAPVLVEAGKGLIDPCPLWDDDGKNYLVHAYAGSRAGIKSVLVVKELNEDGTKTVDKGRIVFDGHEIDPTVEGPKFYKRNGYYYIFAPAGGVKTGWQLVLRSNKIFGPYERKVVLEQGSTAINGPHQGAWIDTPSGEDWFIHFQDKEAYGRVVHLQPMKWVNGWPVIGLDKNNDGIGEPVLVYKKPNVEKSYPLTTPVESDEFNSSELGLQWQWQANPKGTWIFANATTGSLRIYSDKMAEGAKNLWEAPNLLLQKFPAEEFMATMKFTFKPNGNSENEKAGFVIMGQSYASLALVNTNSGLSLMYSMCTNAAKGNAEAGKEIAKTKNSTLYIRAVITKNAHCKFMYSFDGKKYTEINDDFQAEPGRWIGAKLGIFCTRESQTNDSGYADFEWFRIETIQ